MRYKKEEKYVNVPLTIDSYEKLKEIADYEKRNVCRQAAQFIKKAIRAYDKEQCNI